MAQLRSPIDYGFRLQGRRVGALPDRSITLLAGGPGAVPHPRFLDDVVLGACLQCGVCSASCELAEPGSQFPRREMGLLQLGEWRKLLHDPRIWSCYNCTDCSASCPADARPGRAMAALRQAALVDLTRPRFLVGVLDEPRKAAVAVAGSALLVAGAIAIGGSFQPSTHPVVYASFFPHMALNLFFFVFTAFAGGVGILTSTRAWRAWRGPGAPAVRPGLLLRAIREVAVEVVAHRRFAKCARFPWSRLAHAALFGGFVVLAALAGVVALLLLFGVPYPLPVLHPLKLLGNAAGLFLVAGAGTFAVQRWKARRDDPSRFQDWGLLAVVGLVGLTGFAVEGFRLAEVAVLAYPTYFIHLVAVFVLLVGLPFSKLAHVLHRTVALVSMAAERLRRAQDDASRWDHDTRLAS